MKLKRETFFFSARLFLLFLGCVYLSAFLSLWIQVEGLIGTNGILPATEYIQFVYEKLGTKAYNIIPSLFWFYPTSLLLHVLCGGGVLFSCLLILGICPSFSLFLLWLFYLSLVNIGQIFLRFQWDILLLETGFLSIFLALFSNFQKNNFWIKLSLKNFIYNGFTKSVFSSVDFLHENKNRIIAFSSFLWLLRWLLFRLLFASGLVKWISDETWRKLNALTYHYETQPLPTILGWYAHQLPNWFQKLSVVGVFSIELLFPFFIFMPRPLRNIGFFGLIALQVLILLTGNFGFFNWLTIALCFLLISDTSWQSFFSFFNEKTHYYNKLKYRLHFIFSITDQNLSHFFQYLYSHYSCFRFWKNNQKWKRQLTNRYSISLVIALTIFLFLFSTIRFITPFFPQNKIHHEFRALFSWLAPYYLGNHYGLFANMTEKRFEIIIEGSNDLLIWHPYFFTWKPDNIRKAPSVVAPHQPRLDWQMWFAALRRSCHQNPWFIRFLRRLLESKKEVLQLLSKRSTLYKHMPPKYIRAILYEYKFTNLKNKQKDGTWWMRKVRGNYCPILSQKQIQKNHNPILK